MISEALYIDFLNNLIEGNKKNCTLIIDNLLKNGTSIKEVYMDLIQKSMYRIGQLWDRNKITIAEEHAASHIVVRDAAPAVPSLFHHAKQRRAVPSYYRFMLMVSANI